jgi:hypothetical protein
MDSPFAKGGAARQPGELQFMRNQILDAFY